MIGPWPRLRGRLRVFNNVMIAWLVGVLIVFVIESFLVDSQPYDYYILMRGADLFCFHQGAFHYGWPFYYPAPFYTAFCLPYHFAEPLLRWTWMLAPVMMTLWLAQGRAAALVYPPLGVLLLIGQSSWLVLPPFWVGVRDQAGEEAPWWHGLLVALGLFKPHIALPVWVWLGWRWLKRRQWAALAAWAAGVAILVVPSFLIRPGWLVEWLPQPRGYEPVNLATLAQIPVVLGHVTFAPDRETQVVIYALCLLMGVILYAIVRWRRGGLALYDWTLVVFLVNPMLHDYDLLALLPFIARSRRRLLLALTVGVLVWLFAMMSRVTAPKGRWSMSLLITLVLLADRLWNVRRGKAAPAT